MPLSPGTRLGTYELSTALGAGGMGEVYRARDLKLGREVAIKVLPAGMSEHPERLARFEREARTVAALNHPNIVTLHAIEQDGETRFLVLELVEGAPLSESVVPGGLPLARVLAVVLPLAEALAAAHERGVVHRDLKPGNVMLTREGRVKVLDFGLAKSQAAAIAGDDTSLETVATPLSEAGVVLGTLPYMAPEQVRGGATDARTDLFAFGVLLYELLSGRRPFDGATRADLTTAILRDVPEPLRTRRPELPADLDRIVARLLEKDPAQRFASARDLRVELEVVRRVHEAAPVSAVSAATAASGASPEVTPAADAMPSIAVLPFVNRSSDPEDEYFADGIADELLAVLAKIRGLRVAARASAARFRGADDDPASIGRKLNVGTLLEGTVRKAGNRARITVQLVNAADGFHLWSETFDRTLEDIFAVQDDIAQSVVKELRTALLGRVPDSRASGDAHAEVAAAAAGRGTDPEAHRLFLHGRFFAQRGGVDDLRRGVAVLRKAVERDPSHANAWASLGRSLVYLTGYGGLEIHAGNTEAKAAIDRALALEPDLVEGLIAISAWQLWYGWDWRSAGEASRRAVELAPTYGEALATASTIAYSRGDAAEALRLGQAALAIDPLNSHTLVIYTRALHVNEKFAEAEAILRSAIELSPETVALHSSLAYNLAELGRPDEALEVAKREPARWARLTAESILLHRLGRTAEAETSFAELRRDFAGEAGYQIAEVYAMTSRPDEAFHWLDQAYEIRDSGLAVCKLSRRLRPLHADPRWPALLAKLNLAD
ncbi:MAG: protein kinase [Candidatus Eisenbacteria bacterium]